MKKFTRLLTFLCCLLSALAASAYDFEVNGIYYDKTSDTEVAITYGDPDYSGEVTIPAEVSYNGKSYSVTSIGACAFKDCSGLTAITIPESVTSIGAGAFLGCSGLTAITIPGSVTSIDASVFSGCSGLTAISIPGSVTSIGDFAFEDCSGIKELKIEDGTETLSLGVNGYYGLFRDCPLETVYLGRNLSYEYTSISGRYSPFFNQKNLTDLTIGNTVTTLGDYAFYGCSGLTAITIPGSVTSIADYAFCGCSGLTAITIPGSVTSIADYAFCECSGIKELKIEDGTETLSLGYNGVGGLFIDCPLETVYLGRNLSYNTSDSSRNSPFFYKKNLTDLTIGNTVTTLGDYAFYGCSGLTAITILGSVTSIGSSAFYGCSGLTAITIPGSVTSIGDKAFEGCRGLTAINIPGSVKSIGSSAFSGCSGLTEINIPSSVTKIEFGTFRNCSGLTAINIPGSVTYIGYSAFSGCSGLTAITIPGSVTAISERTFYGCTGLRIITLPNSISSIGESAFWNADLSEIIIPAGVTEIGKSAFAGNKNLTKVVTLNTTPPEIDTTTFDSDVEATATLHVQKGCMVHYWLDPVWKEFANMADDILCLQAIPAATYGDGEIDLAQYAPEGVALKYETSNEDVVRINGTKMQIVGAGMATVGALLAEEGTPMEIMGQMRQFTVNQADLTITVADITIEEGQPLPDFSYLADGLKYDDTLDDIETLPQPICEVDENSAAGEYPVTFTQGSDRNYRIATLPAKVIVKKSDSINDIRTDTEAEVEVFSTNGVLIFKGPKADVRLDKGIYIFLQGKTVRKIMVK